MRCVTPAATCRQHCRPAALVGESVDATATASLAAFESLDAASAVRPSAPGRDDPHGGGVGGSGGHACRVPPTCEGRAPTAHGGAGPRADTRHPPVKAPGERPLPSETGRGRLASTSVSARRPPKFMSRLSAVERSPAWNVHRGPLVLPQALRCAMGAGDRAYSDTDALGNPANSVARDWRAQSVRFATPALPRHSRHWPGGRCLGCRRIRQPAGDAQDAVRRTLTVRLNPAPSTKGIIAGWSPFPQFTFTGIWTVDPIELRDLAGNTIR